MNGPMPECECGERARLWRHTLVAVLGGLALLALVIVLAAFDIDACTSAGGVMVRTVGGGWTCLHEARHE